MKSSKPITKEQRCKMYGEWIRLKLNHKYTFEQFLILTINLNKNERR
jgi:hypothetical protein